MRSRGSAEWREEEECYNVHGWPPAGSEAKRDKGGEHRLMMGHQIEEYNRKKQEERTRLNGVFEYFSVFLNSNEFSGFLTDF